MWKTFVAIFFLICGLASGGWPSASAVNVKQPYPAKARAAGSKTQYSGFTEEQANDVIATFEQFVNIFKPEYDFMTVEFVKQGLQQNFTDFEFDIVLARTEIETRIPLAEEFISLTLIYTSPTTLATLIVDGIGYHNTTSDKTNQPHPLLRDVCMCGICPGSTESEVHQEADSSYLRHLLCRMTAKHQYQKIGLASAHCRQEYQLSVRGYSEKEVLRTFQGIRLIAKAFGGDVLASNGAAIIWLGNKLWHEGLSPSLILTTMREPLVTVEYTNTVFFLCYFDATLNAFILTSEHSW